MLPRLALRSCPEACCVTRAWLLSRVRLYLQGPMLRSEDYRAVPPGSAGRKAGDNSAGKQASQRPRPAQGRAQLDHNLPLSSGMKLSSLAARHWVLEGIYPGPGRADYSAGKPCLPIILVLRERTVNSTPHYPAQTSSVLEHLPMLSSSSSSS